MHDGRTGPELSKESTEVIVSFNPSTEQELGRVVCVGRDGIDRAMARAKEAGALWADLPVRERQRYLGHLGDAILERADEIATLIAREQGKPVVEARLAEIVPVLAIVRNLRREAHRVLRAATSRHELILLAHKNSECRFVPYGVVVVISPWNYPFSVPVPQIAAALVAGNTVVFKPAPAAVLVGQMIDDLFRQAGFPERVMNTIFVTDDDAPYLVQHAQSNKIVFTGSTETGKQIMRSASGNLTPVLLELGGKDAAVVCADANVERAARGIVWGAMFTTGQVCASIERVYVERPIAEQFIRACVEEVSRLKVGDPLDEEMDVGPLTTKEQLDVVVAHLDDAVSKGAHVEIGGKRVGERGFFFQPTVLTNVNHSMKIMQEETFGPVLPVMTVGSLDEAIVLANDSPYGLSAFGWTNDAGTAERLKRELQAGTVMINDSTCTWGEPNAPWGGVKQSGIGRSRSRFGLLEMVQIKYVSFDKGRKSYNPWWFPYNKGVREFADQAMAGLFAPRMRTRLRSLLRLLMNDRFAKTAHWGSILRNLRKLF